MENVLTQIADAAFDNNRPVAQAALSFTVGAFVGLMLLALTMALGA